MRAAEITAMAWIAVGLGCSDAANPLPQHDAGPAAQRGLQRAVADYCERLLAAELARLVECFGASADRLAREHEQLLAVVPYRCAPVPPSEGDFTFDESAAAGCINRTLASTCDELMTHWLAELLDRAKTHPQVFESCRSVFVGVASEGESCSGHDGPLCAPQLVCDDRSQLSYGGYSAPGGCTMTCVATSGAKGIAEECPGVGFQCIEGLPCTPTTEEPLCLRVPELGESFETLARCIGTNVCDFSLRQCVAPGGEGSPCDTAYPLLDRCEGALLRCGPESTCERLRSVGESCAAGQVCAWGDCRNGVCVEPPLLGEACDLSVEPPRWCAPGGYCELDTGPSLCVPEHKAGEECAFDRQCHVAECVDGTCERRRLDCD